MFRYLSDAVLDALLPALLCEREDLGVAVSEAHGSALM